MISTALRGTRSLKTVTLAGCALLAAGYAGVVSGPPAHAQRTELPTCYAGNNDWVYECNGCGGNGTCKYCWDPSSNQYVHSCDGCQTHFEGNTIVGGTCLVGTCSGACGGPSDGNCFCDAACSGFGDCCSDYEETCSCGPNGNKCGGQAAECFCDTACHGFGDCCEDKIPECGTPTFCHCDPVYPDYIVYEGGNPTAPSYAPEPGGAALNCAQRGGCDPNTGISCRDGYTPSTCVWN